MKFPSQASSAALSRRRFLQISTYAVGAAASSLPLLLRAENSKSKPNIASIGAMGSVLSAASQERPGHYFKLAIAEPLRHQFVNELSESLISSKQNGYNAIWIENDYLRWSFEPDPDNGFNGNWRLFNIFDFTYGSHVQEYHDYLSTLCTMCKEIGLDIYASFWLPKTNQEMLAYLRKNDPDAIGIESIKTETNQTVYTLCTCKDGKGLEFLGRMVEKFMTDYPQVRGLKVATFDNGAAICSKLCPHAHGTGTEEHVVNMFETVQTAMHKVRPDSDLLLYPWYWNSALQDLAVNRIQRPFYVVAKMELQSVFQQEEGIPGEPLADSSIESEKPGKDILYWIDHVGAAKIIDMVPLGTGVDDWYLAAPPFPGRVYRRFKVLDSLGVRSFMDYECGGHHRNSVEKAVGLFDEFPHLKEGDFLRMLATRVYQKSEARDWGVNGWKAFDKGFGKLPIGLGQTGSPAFSGRFGQGWCLAIATPMEWEAYGDTDRWHEFHWFSPYNFFRAPIADRLQTWFTQVVEYWHEAALDLAVADEIEGHTQESSIEAIAAEAHYLAASSAVNWCNAARLSKNKENTYAFRDLCRSELDLTERFYELLKENPWIWDNNCWHPHHTPLSQRKLGIDITRFHNTFESKIFIMKKRLMETPG